MPGAIGVAEAPPAPAATAPARTWLAPEAEAGPPAEADGAASLQAGSEVPPVYRTLLPPAAVLRYEVRRQHARGTGEIRWQPGPGTYRLQLAASLGTLALLAQSSEGRIDAAGLAPDRFVDRRARRSAQAVNFQREAGTLAFSGPAIERPLLPGTQDRLSWMFQLAGIAAADPELVAAGRRIAMVVVGARGDASVWSLRSAGPDRIETPGGWVDAIRVVRENRSGYDSGAEVWLDPARHYLPVHATQRSARGEAEFELRLDRREPGS